MTAATFPFWARFALDAPAQSSARTAPAPKRKGGPVFIHDAVTPCQGETVLSLMLKRDLAALEADDTEA